jgi:hypothetical protein
MGTPGERYAENLKVSGEISIILDLFINVLQILRDIGSSSYTRVVALASGPDSDRYQKLKDEIGKHFIGPDSYWKKSDEDAIPGCSSYFGNAWWIPFPPTLVSLSTNLEFGRLQKVISRFCDTMMALMLY